MGKSSTLLAQIFSLLIRQLAETLDNIYEVSNCPTPPYVLPALSNDPTDLYKFVWAELEEVWVWLFNSMDMLESQLRFGSSMSRKVILVLISVSVYSSFSHSTPSLVLCSGMILSTCILTCTFTCACTGIQLNFLAW